MVYKIADNIISPLGATTDQNYKAVKAGRSALRLYTEYPGIPEPFTASLFSERQSEEYQIEGLSRFESLVVNSIRKAVNEAAIDISQKKVVFVLSTTKANIEQLKSDSVDENDYPGICAKHIADFLGIKTMPIVVCNACISGLSAIILASRLLECQYYDEAIVCGADCQSQFIISGFQSFKALSPDSCKPFDIERTGLNLGEAAATIILSRNKRDEASWEIQSGCIRNDAYHISAPSRNGEGTFLTLQSILADDDIASLAVVNAHGTATLFNDQMESVAIDRAGLTEIPVNSLKGYFGHTMGAAGILETLITMKSIEDNTILATRGYTELGVSGKIHPTEQNISTTKSRFVKMLSGFGGCNAAIVCSLGDSKPSIPQLRTLKVLHHVTITPDRVIVDGQTLEQDSHGKQLLTDLYKHYIDDYPKFYKMDMLCRLGFVASELLLKLEKGDRPTSVSERAVILFNRTSSIDTDKNYLESICHTDNYYPSPSIFVYTLPNIITGEISIRNGYQGETSFYVLPARDDAYMKQVVEASLVDKGIKSVLTGWLDYANENDFMADLYLECIE